MKKKTTTKKSQKRKKSPPKGQALLNQVIKMTGLPSSDLKNELKDILDRKNINVHNLNLGQLRCAAASYVRDIMMSIRERYSLKKNESAH